MPSDGVSLPLVAGLFRKAQELPLWWRVALAASELLRERHHALLDRRVPVVERKDTGGHGGGSTSKMQRS